MKLPYIILRRPAALSLDPFPSPLENFPGAAAAGAGLNDTLPMEATLRVDMDELTPQQAERLAAESGVQAAFPNMPATLIEPMDTPGPVPDAATEAIAWGIKAVGADTSHRDGAGITVGVLDTGIDANHPAFAGVQLIQKDFTGTGSADTNGHGTHCAGTIFGRDVAGQRIGVARGVTRALIGKVLAPGKGDTKSIMDAITWAVDNGANVISMSLGIDFPGFVARLEGMGVPTRAAVSKALNAYRLTVNAYQSQAMALANRNQLTGGACILVAASGNESRVTVDPNTSLDIEASPPSISQGFICVGALGQDGALLSRAAFSNTNVNISAPGVAVLSARANSQELTRKDGTSMATPHVAGVAALWAQELQAKNMLNARNLEGRLTGTAITSVFAPNTRAADIGIGLVRAPQPSPVL